MGVKTTLGKLVKYFLTTLLGTATDTLVLWLMSDFVVGDSHFEQYVLSPVVSFECAVIINYFTAYFYVWRDRITTRSKRGFFGRFWKYNMSCISAFIVKMMLLNGVALVSQWDPVICNLIALCFSGLLNFAINEFVVFRKKEPKRPEE